MKPQSPLEMPRYGGLTTFSRLPYVPMEKRPPKGVKVAVFGVPFDGGTTFRPGARLGPRAIREASVLNRNYNLALDVDVFARLGACDFGDIPVNPVNLQKSLEMIEEKTRFLAKSKLMGVALGGDHLMVYPILKSFRKAWGKFTLVHFDAHTDMADQAWGEKWHHGTPMRRLIEAKILDPRRVFQISLRGPWASAEQEAFAHDRGVKQLLADDVANAAKADAFFREIHAVAGSEPVYVSFDVDGVDPAFAPGTGTPVVGGMTSREALQCLRKLRGLNVCGGDVVEVSPAYDHAQITSLLASAVVFEIMSLMAAKN